jgi:hypothetical protein
MLSSIIGIKPWSKSNTLSNEHGETYREHVSEFTSSPICPHTILLAYERAKHRKMKEDTGNFKHEPTSNADYNQDMEMEMEGLYGDDTEVIKMMALHGSNVPNNTSSLPRGYDYDWSKPTFPRNPDLCKTAKLFLTEAQDSSGTDVA